MRAKIIPDVVSPCHVLSLPPAATVRDAARLMADRHVAALLVQGAGVDGALLGIVTERDVTVRVVAAGLDPDAATLNQVMTANPRTLTPDDSVFEALELMQTHGFRHLPVVDDDNLPVGMVSIRDLYKAVQSQLEREVQDRDAWIIGSADAWG